MSSAAAQELEPGAYAVAPVGMNVLVLANAFSKGDLAFDPSGPIQDARGKINVTSAAYMRTLNLVGRSAQASIGVPITAGHLEGVYLGERTEVTRVGLADPRVRVAINLYGAPAMDAKLFTAFRPKRLIGASVTVALPVGNYSSERLINVGGGRWAVKPEIGVVHFFGRWTVETFAGVWLFAKNDEFYRGSVKTQDPIGSLQFHVHYAIRPRLVVAANANFYTGGRTTVNGKENLDLQRNSRLGATLVWPVGRGRALRLAVSRGAYTTIGADFTSVAFAFQQAW